MSITAENGGGDSAYTRSGDRHGNTSKGQGAPSPSHRDVSSASVERTTPQSNIGKVKRKAPNTRPSRPARDSSPTRSVTGSRPVQALARSVKPSSSHADLQQPRAAQPPANNSYSAVHTTPRLTISQTPPPEGRQLPPSPRKKNLPSVPPSPSTARPDDSDQSEANEPMKTPTRSNSSTALETVIESSLPTTPAIGMTLRSLEGTVASLIRRVSSSDNIPEEDDDDDSASTITRQGGRRDSVSSSIAPMSTAESESESGYRTDDKTPTSSYRAPPPARPFGRRPTVTGKDTSKVMTVETETVSSVPQVGLGNVGPAGTTSLRSKKSTDTIKAPRRERKRTLKKSSAMGPSNLRPASSKADIFAAKVADAIDEHRDNDSDDSAETFVYESNPPDSTHTLHHRPSTRFHSRTPSATSIGPDHRGQRLPLIDNMGGANSTGRKGMKFVNNNKDLGGDGVSSDHNGGAGSSREHGVGRRHHNGHRSLLSEDPFNRAAHRSTTSLRNAASSFISSRQSSRPPSPKLSAFRNGNPAGGKRSPRTRVYEADVENGDDEHTPLMVPRSRRRAGRPPNGSLRQMEYNARRRGWIRTYAGCIVAIIAIMLILTGVGGFLVATTNALQGVRVLNVTDVLVSKQEIMLDLVVEAMNPNAIAVTVGSMDINIFAKSSHIRDGDGDGDGGDGGKGGKGGDGKDGDKGGDKDGDKGGDGDTDKPVQPVDPTDPPKADPIPSNPSLFTSSDEILLGTLTRRYPPAIVRSIQHILEGVDEGTDPPPGSPGSPTPDEPESETMLLGRIFSFDSVLTFEPSPIRRQPSVSIGELRLPKPGNKTETNGTERWERVLLHPFELIVRGVLKYQLPLSGRIRTAPVAGSVVIHPELGEGGGTVWRVGKRGMVVGMDQARKRDMAGIGEIDGMDGMDNGKRKLKDTEDTEDVEDAEDNSGNLRGTKAVNKRRSEGYDL